MFAVYQDQTPPGMSSGEPFSWAKQLLRTSILSLTVILQPVVCPFCIRFAQLIRLYVEFLRFEHCVSRKSRVSRNAQKNQKDRGHLDPCCITPWGLQRTFQPSALPVTVIAPISSTI